MSVVYRRMIGSVDRLVPVGLRPLWDHPAGPKTIHFWAPLGKWSLVIAGLGDAARPAEKLSLNQSLALSATGLIWSRYSLVIIPKNYSLFAVNVFVASTGLSQLYRIWRYRSTQPTAALIQPVGVAVVDNPAHPVHGTRTVLSFLVASAC